MTHGTLQRQQTLGRKWGMFAPVVDETNDTDSFLSTLNRPSDLLTKALDVDPYQKLRLRFFGTAAANLDATIQLLGFYDDGPGHRIGQVVMKTGGHSPTGSFPDGMVPSVAREFDPDVAWFEVDTYTISLTEGSAILAKSTQSVDGANHLTLDLSDSLYKYVLTEIKLPATTPMAKCGGIYIPIG